MITQPLHLRISVNLASLQKINLLALEAAFLGGKKRGNNSVLEAGLVRKPQKRRVESGKTRILNSQRPFPKFWGQLKPNPELDHP